MIIAGRSMEGNRLNLMALSSLENLVQGRRATVLLTEWIDLGKRDSEVKGRVTGEIMNPKIPG